MSAKLKVKWNKLATQYTAIEMLIRIAKAGNTKEKMDQLELSIGAENRRELEREYAELVKLLEEQAAELSAVLKKVGPHE